MSTMYTGTAPASTPDFIQFVMKDLAGSLSDHGYHLRTGGNENGDEAFMDPVSPSRRTLYLPWDGFNGHGSPHVAVSDDALDLASHFHPVWDDLSDGVQKIHGRTCYELLGAGLDRPSAFLITWTPDGAVDALDCSIRTGGLSTAIRLADYMDVPIYNLGNKQHYRRLQLFSEEPEHFF